MKTETNKFGTGVLYDAEDLNGKTFCSCAACMSVYADFLSWANTNVEKITHVPNLADNIVVLSCQVTDLAVLNDLRTLERYAVINPTCTLYIGGCLAKRFDIELPENVRRLNNVDADGTFIRSTALVHYEKPLGTRV